jgi:hypothetical protein
MVTSRLGDPGNGFASRVLERSYWSTAMPRWFRYDTFVGDFGRWRQKYLLPGRSFFVAGIHNFLRRSDGVGNGETEDQWKGG